MARNIQNAGGYMAIIVNDKDGDVKKFPVYDDGFGNKIGISALLIGRREGNIILNYMNSNPNSTIQLEVQYTLEKREKVDVDFYIHINDEEAFYIISEFLPFYNILEKQNITLNMYYITHEIDGLNNNEKNEMCLSEGKHCLNLNMPRNFQVKGRDLVKESIYHQCVYEIAKLSGSYEKFLNFAKYYYDNCLFSVKFKQYCGREYLTELNIDEEKVFGCFNESFGVSGGNLTENDLNKRNTLLEENYNKMVDRGIKIIPAIDINGKRMKGSLSVDDLFSNICNSFIEKPTECIDYYYVPTRRPNKLEWYHIFWIIMGVVVVNLVIYIVCRKYVIKRVDERINTNDFDLDGRINTVVSSYLALRDVKKGRESSSN